MADSTVSDELLAAIRTIPDYPKEGIIFRDITTLLGNARAFRRAVDALVQPWAGSKVDKVAGNQMTSLGHENPEMFWAASAGTRESAPGTIRSGPGTAWAVGSLFA